MFESFFRSLCAVDAFVWDFIGVPAILLLGLFLSFKAKWFQIVDFKKITKLFFSFLYADHSHDKRGLHPLKVFFASLGGCIGIGNIVVVCTAVQVGGPGAVFWMWIAALLGMIVKYSEVYLGIKYRIKNQDDSYDGGPMYFLQKATSSWWIPRIVCVLLCIYGVDMYLFRIVTDTMAEMWGFDHFLIVFALLGLVIYTTRRGIEGVSTIASIIIPVFLIVFSGVSIIILIKNIAYLPGVIKLILRSAFTGHAALGAFTGSSLLLTMSQGMKRACYSGDIGIGYAAVINSETEEADPAKQAALSIFGVFIDTFVICTMSVLLILITGLWNQGIHEGKIIALAIEDHVSFITILWPLFIFLLGYSNIIAIFSVGEKAAQFLSPRYGKRWYLAYAIPVFLFFSFVGSKQQLLTIMSMTGILLLLINLWGILKLYKNISFSLTESSSSDSQKS
jgi:AGCS family alanine or glycine:cation symporter